MKTSFHIPNFYEPLKVLSFQKKMLLNKGAYCFIVAILVLGLMLGTRNAPIAYGAGLNVNSTQDNAIAGDGKCTLREAINNANSDKDTTSGDCVGGSGSDTITFSVIGTIRLSTPLPLLASTQTLTINGPGASSLTISGDTDGDGIGNVPILNLPSGATLNLDGLTLANGLRSGTEFGGAISNRGTVNVSNSVFSGNSASRGGGIWSNFSTTLNVTNCTFSNNSARTGGAIENFGNMNVSNSIFSGNKATNDNGGAIRNISGGLVTIANSTFSNNFSSSFGGAIGNAMGNSSVIVTITNSTFSNNTVNRDGGAIKNSYGGNLIILNSTISNNISSGAGGGIQNLGTLTVANSTLSNNSATNSASRGGGVSNEVYQGLGGILNITNTTIFGNSAFDGGNIKNANAGTLTLRNTIVANSLIGRNCTGTITDGTGNLRWPNTDASCVGIFGDPKLGSLSNGGGSTQTMALLPESAAIDTGIDSLCSPAVGSPNYGAGGLDQRGVIRPQGTHCDIGAYER